MCGDLLGWVFGVVVVGVFVGGVVVFVVWFDLFVLG